MLFVVASGLFAWGPRPGRHVEIGRAVPPFCVQIDCPANPAAVFLQRGGVEISRPFVVEAVDRCVQIELAQVGLFTTVQDAKDVPDGHSECLSRRDGHKPPLCRVAQKIQQIGHGIFLCHIASLRHIDRTWPIYRIQYNMATPIFPRALGPALASDLEVYPVVAVMGARQVGKSTLCRGIADARGFTSCTLDDQDILEKAREFPEALLDDLGPGAFIDEAQRAPGLFLAIKSVVDRQQRAGAYLLSGSNQPRVSSAVGDSLLGRAAYRTLRPITLSEQRLSEEHPGWSFLFGDDDRSVLDELHARAQSSGALDWRDVVRTGGFPRALAAPAEYRTRLLDDYVEVFANRDIRDVLGIESPERFEGFFRIVGAWTGQELNASAISRDLGIPVNTIRRWIDALERSYLIELVPSYSRNPSQRVIRSPKLFVVDSALALAAARETEPTGFHLETFIYTDLAVWRDAAPGRALYHWRLSSGQEVDFVLQEAQHLLPLEIKATDDVRNTHTRHLRKFRDTYKTPRGVILSNDPAIRRMDGGIIAAPWWAVA